uniref:DNA replication complex GINS protein PSF3 n=1 Tax=Anopheles melas TaxID=34690 RepID=A0A182TX44_9DIPT
MNIPSFRPNYYSLDDIAITQERIPCRTTQDLHMMGKGDMIALVPDIYSAAYKEIYQADANYVELGALCKFYFELGMYLTRYQNNNSVAEMLYTTAQERLKGLKDLCQNVGNDSLNVASKFDFSERLLFNEGTKTNKLFDDWLQERQVHIKSTEIAINIRKRKRSPDGDTQEEQQ